MPIFLKHIEGSRSGQIDSFDAEKIRIGRQADNDVKFDPQKDASVSGYHAELYREGDAYYLKDLQSRNGTFLNSRKIDGAVPLNDGDTLQFSARGPKLIFSTRDSAVSGQTVALEQPRVTSSSRSAPMEAPEKRSAIRANLIPISIAIVTVLVLLGTAIYVGLSWWALLIGAAAILLVAGGAYIGWRFWKRRKALKERAEAARDEREESLGRGDKDNLQDLRRKWTEVLRSLRGSKFQQAGDDAIYALPWFILLGEPGCGKSSLVKSSGPLSSVVASGKDGPTSNCDWWFFEKLVLLDTSGRYAVQTKGSDSAGEWQALIDLLRRNRQREPINGVLIALPADAIASRAVDKLKEQAAQLRERLDDLAQRLGVKFPVYLAITKCDLIAGFGEFFQALPDRVKGQALGYGNSETVSNTDIAGFFERAFHAVCERLERLRLAIIGEREQHAATRGTFLFPAEIRSFHAPLRAFVDVLFRPSPYRDAPFFRGLFFTSARQGGAPRSRLSRLLGVNYSRQEPSGASRDHFSRDLFSSILPNDRTLVGRTAMGIERYQLTRAAGLIISIAASLLLCGIFTLSFTSNWLALKRLDIKPCMGASGGESIAKVLRPLDDCRESIENLTAHSMWKKLAMNFGLGESKRVAAALRQRFLTVFRTSVLNPMDARIDQILSGGSPNPMVVGAVMQRVEMITRCSEQPGCAGRNESENLDFRVVLAGGARQADGDILSAERMRRAHRAYIVWQTDPIRQEMQSKDLERIERWLSAGGLREDRILETASAAFPPIQAADFWGFATPGRVDPAYTAQAWREGIAPLVSGLRKMPNRTAGFTESVKNFEVSYRTQALRQWGDFLGEFPQMERAAVQRGMTRDIALVLQGGKSPYSRIVQAAHDNLSVVLGDAWQSGELQPWAATLQRYVALKAKVADAQKSAKTASPEAGQGKEADALKYLAVFLNSLDQVRAELNTPERSFASAKKAFEEREASSGATQPILKASWALEMLRSTIGSPQGDDRLIWIVLASPVALGWKAILEESGKHLQQQWEGLLLEVRDLESGPKGGKIISFVNGSAAVFLSRQGSYWVPRRVLNQGLSFTDAFIQYLSRLRLDALQSTSASSAPAPFSTGPQPPPYIVRTS